MASPERCHIYKEYLKVEILGATHEFVLNGFALLTSAQLRVMICGLLQHIKKFSDIVKAKKPVRLMYILETTGQIILMHD
jgi:hypothetical protein